MLLPLNSYIVRLYKANKFLFFSAMLFVLLNLAVNFFDKAELTPFFKWDLYANSTADQKQYSFLEIRYNDNKLLSFPHTWQEPEKLFFTNTMNLFIAMKNNHDADLLKDYYRNNWLQRHKLFSNIFTEQEILNDSTGIKQFPTWYKRYLSQHINQPVDSIKVFKKTVEYEDNGSAKEISSELIYSIL